MSFDDAFLKCAMPAVCEIKPSCLFSMKKSDDFDACKKARATGSKISGFGKKIAVIAKEDGQSLYFVYDKDEILRLCENRRATSYLKDKGYTFDRGIDYVLARLFSRLKNCKSFPHEVGLFLGYPLSDVIQFEKQGGAGYAYSGYWKVYSNVENALCQMARYKECSAFCMNECRRGTSICETVKKYKNEI